MCLSFLGEVLLFTEQTLSTTVRILTLLGTVAYPGILFSEGGGGEGGSTNSVEDRGQRERGSGGGSRLVRSSAQFVIRGKKTGVFSTELGIRLSFVKTSEFRGGGLNPRTPPRYATA
jgi:hypothetical protein